MTSTRPTTATTRPVGVCCITGCAFPSMDLLHRCCKCQRYVHVLCAEDFKPTDSTLIDADSLWCDKCSPKTQPDPTFASLPQVVDPQCGDAPRQPQPSKKNSTTSASDRCSARNCPLSVPGLEKVACANPGCKKMVHLPCYQGIVLKHNKLHALPGSKVVCCKKCYLAVSSSLDEVDGDGNDIGKRGNWDCDGLGGPTDPHTSQKILLDWWLAEGNYAKYCGKCNDGVKKSHFQLVLANQMTQQTKSKRTARNVKSKIEQIERSFKKAHKFCTSETGVGLMAENDNSTFQKMVRDICAYYYELVDIMADRAGVQPKVTTYDDLELVENSPLERNSSEDSPDIEFVGCDDCASNDGSRNNDSPLCEVIPNTTPNKETLLKRSQSKRKDRKTSPGIDDALLVLNQSSESCNNKMKEMERHHRMMEKVEFEKLQLEKFKFQKNSWSERTEELHYRKNLLREYRVLRLEEKLTDKQIIALIPDMKIAIDALNSGPNRDAGSDLDEQVADRVVGRSAGTEKESSDASSDLENSKEK